MREGKANIEYRTLNIEPRKRRTPPDLPQFAFPSFDIPRFAFSPAFSPGSPFNRFGAQLGRAGEGCGAAETVSRVFLLESHLMFDNIIFIDMINRILDIDGSVTTWGRKWNGIIILLGSFQRSLAVRTSQRRQKALA